MKLSYIEKLSFDHFSNKCIHKYSFDLRIRLITGKPLTDLFKTKAAVFYSYAYEL